MKKTWWIGVLYILTLTFATQALADWPMFQANAQHTGQADVIATQDADLRWSLDLGRQISPLGGPSVGQYDGQTQIIVGADDGVYVINREGIQTQRISSSLPIETVVAIAGGTLYFGAGNTLYAYRPDGEYWSSGGFDGPLSHVTIFENRLYVCDEDRLWVFTLDGTLDWMSEDLAGTIIRSAPALDSSGNIYVVSSQQLWDDFVVYVYRPDGELLWSYDYLGFEGNGAQMAPTLDSSGNVYLATYWNTFWPSQMHCLRNDDLLWSEDTRATYSSPAIAANMLYYGTDDGLEAIQTSGAFAWLRPTQSSVRYSSPAIGSDGTTYVGTEGGQMLAITSSGGIKWSLGNLPGAISSPAIGSDGAVYVTAGSSLFAFGEQSVDVEDIVQPDLGLTLHPNPCSQRAQASYYLSSAGPVKVMVYDVTGRLVKTALDQDQGRGEHRLEIAGLSSGVYLVRLQAGQESSVRRLVVVR